MHTGILPVNLSKLNPSPWLITQGAHFMLGALCVFVPLALRGKTQAIIGTVLFIGYAAAKELWWDPKTEQATIWPDAVVDLVFLLGGPAVAWILWWLT